MIKITLNNEIEAFLKEQGALRVGFATLETMSEGPEGADLRYMLHEAQSAIGFALPLNKELIRPYLAKSYPNARGDHELDNVKVNVKATKLKSLLIQVVLSKKKMEKLFLYPQIKLKKNLRRWILTDSAYI